MTEQERLIEILRWSPSRFAKMSGDHLIAISKSKRPWWTTKLHKTFDEYYFKMIQLTSNTLEIAAVARYWIAKCDLPLDPTRLASFDHFHEKCSDVWVTSDKKIREINCEKLDNILKEN